MMEIFNGASLEIAGAMIFAWFLMIAFLGEQPDIAPRRIRKHRE
jgi:hypothetical protein